MGWHVNMRNNERIQFDKKSLGIVKYVNRIFE